MQRSYEGELLANAHRLVRKHSFESSVYRTTLELATKFANCPTKTDFSRSDPWTISDAGLADLKVVNTKHFIFIFVLARKPVPFKGLCYITSLIK